MVHQGVVDQTVRELSKISIESCSILDCPLFTSKIRTKCQDFHCSCPRNSDSDWNLFNITRHMIHELVLHQAKWNHSKSPIFRLLMISGVSTSYRTNGIAGFADATSDYAKQGTSSPKIFNLNPL